MTDRKPGKHALTFIFITVLIDMIGIGIILPVLPGLLVDLTGQPLANAALWGGALATLYALMQFVFAPLIGNLSDRFGRRPVLLFSMAGFALDYLIMGLAPVLWVLFIGRALSGVFGATMTTAGAYIADITPPEKRGGNFGLIGAAFGLGFVIGPAVGGVLGEIDIHLPFFAAAGLSVLNLIYGYFVLPETLAPENRRAFSFKNANPLGALKDIRPYPVVYGLMGAFGLFFLGHTSLPIVWSYFGMESFGWSQLDVGLSLTAVGLLTAIVQGGLARILIPKMGAKMAALFGFSVATLSYFAYAFAPNPAFIYAVIVIGSIAGIGGPALQGIVSNEVPANMQGALQGAIGSVRGLTAVIGPGIMTWIFFLFARDDAVIYLPGAPFVLAGLLSVGAVYIIWRVIGHRKVVA